MTKTFTKKVEDFICGHCGTKVKGGGYTNHCPKCLYSKHVDVNPGDRLEICGGLMPPVDFEVSKGEYVLIHECEKCDARKKNRLAEDDNAEALISLSKTIAKKLFF